MKTKIALPAFIVFAAFVLYTAVFSAGDRGTETKTESPKGRALTQQKGMP